MICAIINVFHRLERGEITQQEAWAQLVIIAGSAGLAAYLWSKFAPLFGLGVKPGGPGKFGRPKPKPSNLPKGRGTAARLKKNDCAEMAKETIDNLVDSGIPKDELEIVQILGHDPYGKRTPSCSMQGADGAAYNPGSHVVVRHTDPNTGAVTIYDIASGQEGMPLADYLSEVLAASEGYGHDLIVQSYEWLIDFIK
ncbi:MAG: hypothetical protein AB7K09_16640 [Planctomycetota bacterium]